MSQNPFQNLTPQELSIFKKLTTPQKIQDFLDTLPINFEEHGETCMSPRRVLRNKTAHCIEGAMLAAAMLWFHAQKPLLLDLKAAPHDDDHVVTLFQQGGYWGAISKTNHAVLRYREPIYKTVRELVLSYFHEYTDKKGNKTLRSFSRPFDLRRYKDNPLRHGSSEASWITAEEELWQISDDLDNSPHVSIIPKGLKLRRANALERKAGELTEWKKSLKNKSGSV